MITLPKLKIRPLSFEDERIVDAFRENQLVTGPHLFQLECGLSAVFQFKYVNTVASGFAGLFLALKCLQLNKARVVVPAVSTCYAMTNAVLANDFEVVFCSLDENHLSLSVDALDKIFHSHPCDVIIAPSHFGIPAPIDNYKKYGVPVIEDACQSFFTRTNIHSAADFMVLSFYPTKQFNCIEGGAVLCNNHEYAQRIADLKYYDHQDHYDGKPRYNLRMANIHAAFGCLLLDQLEDDKTQLLQLRDTYIKFIQYKPFLLAAQSEEAVIPWRFLIRVETVGLLDHLKLAGIQADRELLHLKAEFVSTKQVSWIDKYASIPFYNGLSSIDQQHVIQSLNAWN